jgi:hypothetical protein
MAETTKKYFTYRKPSLIKQYKMEFVTVLGGLIAVNLIFVADVYRETDTVNAVTAGQLGDFVGGYIGTIFALISVVFLYSTLKSQRESSAIEKFETKYFELIKMHRDNVAEMDIGDDFGKKIFVMLIREFREIMEVAREVAIKCNLVFSQERIFIISYYALFFGVGPNSSRMLIAALQSFDSHFVIEFEKTLNNKELKREVKARRRFKYIPFEGHQSRLGHHFRHLYQTVSYVEKQTIDIDKYEFVKTVRAQLTTHEQALLFINCLTPIGKAWWDKELFLEYRFVRNIPYGFFDSNSEIEIENYFPDDYFEWQERRTKDVNERTQPT